MTSTSGIEASTTNGVANGISLDWKSFSNVVNGKLVSTSTTRHSINPATGKPNSEVPLSTKDDVDQAMYAAKAAFKPWAAKPWDERVQAVLKFAEALEKEKDAFAQILVQEQGKPLHFALFEMDFAFACLRAVTNIKIEPERIIEDDKEIVIRYTPLGVTVGIVPWNYPILLAVTKIAPAVITGNPIIIKPSPFTPAGALKLVELAQRFFPPGVVQCLSGGDDLGPMLTEHPTPAKISFTGSSFTGKKVMASASKTLKRVTLELGGNDPAIICEDVDIEEVAPKVATLAFLNSGQICLALKRIFVHESIIDKFRDAMVKHTKTLKVGEGNESDVFLGPIQNSMQYERVKGFFKDIEAEKMNVVVGGTNPTGPGYFINPTIIDRPKYDSRLVREEPFGPIVPLLAFSTDEEAIEKANDTNYGLGASVWSGNIARANKIAAQLEAGSVWVNTHFELDPRASFGGHKESGIGTEFGTPSINFQRRWATNEAEARKDEVPISEIQPTPQEEVENVISEDNAAATDNASLEASTFAEDAGAAKSTSGSQSFNSRSGDYESDRSTNSYQSRSRDTDSFRSRVERPPPTPKPTIYVANLFFDVTENDITKEMSRFGAIKRVKIVRDARGLSKGFGYVQFESTDAATQCIERLNQQLFEGRRLNVQFATTDFSSPPSREGREPREPKPLNPPTKTLFIGNMSFEMTDRDLNTLFRGIRNVIDVRVAIDRRTGQPRGFAHADFIDVKSAMEAMKVLEGKEVYGRKLRLDYSYGPSHAPKNTPAEE